ncbi:MAG: hypothetical protein ACK5M7_15775 [Draconibacterium sp.]
MIKKLTVALLVLLLFISARLKAQTHTEEEHEHEHHHVHEIGFSVAPVYFFKAEELSPAIHLHYVYNFPETKFGLGLGYEHIFDDHRHNFVGLELEYRPLHPLTVGLSPGITFEGEHPEEKDFALHFETVYEFELGSFHIGPLLELAYHREDIHLSFGVHIGVGL